ncbi:hypothetical protein GCM10027275_05870 [Rhabdobacter roseus]
MQNMLVEAVRFAAAAANEVAIHGAFESTPRDGEKYLGELGGRGRIDEVKYPKRKEVERLDFRTTSLKKPTDDSVIA